MLTETGVGLESTMSKMDSREQAPDTPRALKDDYCLREGQYY